MRLKRTGLWLLAIVFALPLAAALSPAEAAARAPGVFAPAPGAAIQDASYRRHWRHHHHHRRHHRR